MNFEEKKYVDVSLTDFLITSNGKCVYWEEEKNEDATANKQIHTPITLSSITIRHVWVHLLKTESFFKRSVNST